MLDEHQREGLTQRLEDLAIEWSPQLSPLEFRQFVASWAEDEPLPLEHNPPAVKTRWTQTDTVLNPPEQYANHGKPIRRDPADPFSISWASEEEPCEQDS